MKIHIVQKNVVMRVGRDDEARVYINGVLVYQSAPDTRSEYLSWYAPDQDVVAGVDLAAGLNVIVFKVYNVAGAWEGSVRLTDAQGEPLRGVKLAARP